MSVDAQVKVLESIVEKMDSSIEKLTEVSNSIGKLLAVHDERLNNLETYISSTGEQFNVIDKDSIILFRIIQEFFSNAIKHSNATKLEVFINYLPEELHLEIKDNGKGFNIDEVTKSSGLLNMESRAALINTSFSLNSTIGNGTSLSLQYPTKIPPHEKNDSNR